MRSGLYLLTILSCFAVATPAFAGESTAPNCFIRISGQGRKMRFGTRLRSRAECQALARIHQRSADLDPLGRKHVDYRWKGRRSAG